MTRADFVILWDNFSNDKTLLLSCDFVRYGYRGKTEKRCTVILYFQYFLFAEAMEDPQNMRDVLEIILGKDVVLKHLPQTEKEARISPAYRFAKVDVWAKDTDEVVYDTEVQGTNTKNLPKRSRYYESIIDAKLLKPGERDFNKMNDIYIILIAPFDLFGKRKYMYTFEMTCKEDPSVSLEDGATRIFLNTHGENPDEVSPELVELLHYIEHTTQDMADGCKSERIHKMQKRICSIKSSEEVSVRYMQRWEEMEMEKEAARELGLAEGRTQGLTEGRTQGLAEGRAEGRSSMARLIDKLLEENRIEDCKRIAKDPEFCQHLMEEFGIE